MGKVAFVSQHEKAAEVHEEGRYLKPMFCLWAQTDKLKASWAPGPGTLDKQFASPFFIYSLLTQEQE